MLDINLIRERPEIIRDSQRRRGEDPKKLQHVIELDRKWRGSLTSLNELRHLRNATNKEIITLKEENKDATELIARMKKVSDEIKELDQKVKDYLEERDRLLMTIPNLLHESVPLGEGEKDNVPLRFSGTAKVFPGFKEDFLRDSQGKMDFIEIPGPPISHVDILEMTGLGDIQRAAKVAGARFYYLKDQLVMLDLALQCYAIDFLMDKG
ncbi:MAG: serine--tRNA ligase, partial [Thermoplasmata archaeon]|nr:serine--tRNA ligase [Thermoplasmata archaeon]